MFKGSTNVSSDAAIASGGGGVGVGLQMLLCAATSPATRVTEETLTNLNRGEEIIRGSVRRGDRGNL